MSDVTSWMAESVDERPSAWTHERKPRRNPETAQLREMNKRLRTIYDEAGLNYGEDVVEKELTERFKVAVNLRKNNVKGVLKNLQKAKNVEICFLVDATGSMQAHIDGVKDSITQIVDLLKQPNNTVSRRNKAAANTLRLSMVAYRDFCDSNRYEILNFTESVAEFKIFCSGINATGGGDGPEDVFGGIKKVLNLGWTDECGTKVIFHIADAPCHGRKYHNIEDSYPSGDPNGLAEDDLFKELSEREMDYYFGKITVQTDRMIDIFSQAYGKEIMKFDIKDVKSITNSVFTAVSTSVFFSTKTTRDLVNPRKTRTYKLISEIPAWLFIPELSGRFLNFEMPETIEDVINDVPLIRNQPKRAVVQIAPNPFAHGAERYAFYGRDVTTATAPQNIVLKEYIVVGSGNAAARYEITNQIQTVSSFFANKFNEVFKGKIGYDYYIKFLKVQTLCIPGNDKEEARYFSCEKQYEKDDNFVRFTNNTDYAILEETAEKMFIDIDFVWALTAFSHWTYQATKGKLMVVDLQGIITKTDDGQCTAILTDPAIHCIDETRFGRMNLGKEGMDIFFKRHDCNKYCEALKLIPVLVDGENECF